MGVSVLEDITPNSGSFCNSQRHIGYNFFEAVCDLVDNSISASSSKIEIYINEKNTTHPFVIIDNGLGMNEIELVSAFRLGRSDDVKSEHGKFGFGLKTASISQARILEVHTKYQGVYSARKMDLNYFETTGKWNLLEADTISFVDECLMDKQSGTAVVWKDWDFYDREVAYEHSLIKYLGVIYNKLISDKLQIVVNELIVEPISVIPEEAKLLDQKEESSFSFKIYLLKHPKYWDMDYNQSNGFNSYKLFETTHKDNQGVYIYRNSRLISIYPQWYGIVSNKSNNFSLARIEFFYWNDDVDYGLDIRHSTVKLPKSVKAVFGDFSKMIKRYAAKKMIEGRRPVGVRVSNDKIWNMIAHKDGEISFEINLENPFIKFVVENGDSSKICLMLKKISKELPIGDIISKQERYFIDEKMGHEELNDLKSIYAVLYPGFSEEEINKLL
ncbi:MAG: ATP-binding protein [Lutibacter sp.]|nr:ATP-binding protein [Lutibacter sp.]